MGEQKLHDPNISLKSLKKKGIQKKDYIWVLLDGYWKKFINWFSYSNETKKYEIINESNSNKKQFKFVCQHGTLECYANKLHVI